MTSGAAGIGQQSRGPDAPGTAPWSEDEPGADSPETPGPSLPNRSREVRNCLYVEYRTHRPNPQKRQEPGTEWAHSCLANSSEVEPRYREPKQRELHALP